MKKNSPLPVIVFITYCLSAAGLLFSCTNEKTPGLVFSSGDTIIRPGFTSELTLTAFFTDSAENASNGETGRSHTPDRRALKTFTETDPVINVSADGFKLLSAEPECGESGISARIIIRAGEELLSGDSSTVTAEWAGFSAASVLRVRKNPAARIDADGVVSDPAAYDVFVNKERRMPAGYIPPDLVRVDVPTILTFDEVNHLRRAASDALGAMFAAAEDEHGYELFARSGYRSYKTQVTLYDLNVREHGEDYASRFSARPGTSEHQSGLAMDISSPAVNYQLEQEFGKTTEGAWVRENAHRFGFIIRYPEGKEDITGYSYEPWHLRYVGEALAAEIYSRGLTLEEYFLN